VRHPDGAPAPHDGERMSTKEGTRPTAPQAPGRRDKPAPVVHKFVELIPSGTKVDFVGMRGRMLVFSWALILASLAFTHFVRGGLRLGIDFAGGTMVHVKFAERTSIGDIRAALSKPELGEVIVQDVGRDSREFQIRLLGGEGGQGATSVAAAIEKGLWWDAFWAVLFATVVMGVYIAFRFEVRFGIGAAIALVHDVLLTLGALGVFQMEFDLTTVAALLTVVGYSVHDTVIVSDRIRENMRKMRRDTLATIMNLSINETLSRTLITSGTAILVTLVLFLFGGSVIHSFAFTLLVGFIVGTYSSIYVASPVVLYLEGRTRARR